jgi:hypothetical protein
MAANSRKVFIDGRDMELNTVYEQLLEKYKKRWKTAGW